MQVPELIGPLCDDSERVFIECDDDEEATDGGEMWLERLRIDLKRILGLFCKEPEFLERVVGVGRSVTCGRLWIRETVRVSVVAGGDGTPNVYAGCHG